MADLYGTTAAPASWFADTLDPNVPPAGATMPVMPKRGFWGELGDALAGLGGVNAPAIREANFNKNLTATSEYKLRSAQTEIALAGADKRRIEAMRGSMVNNMITKAQSDPNYKPGISDLLALATGAGDLGQGQLHQQELGQRGAIADLTTPQPQRLADMEAVTGKPVERYYQSGTGMQATQLDPAAAPTVTPVGQASIDSAHALAGQRDAAEALTTLKTQHPELFNAAAVAATGTPPVDADYQNAVAELMGAKPSYGMGAAGQAARQRSLAIKAHLLSDQSYVPPGVTPGMNFANASDAVNNINRFKLSGNPTLARRVATLDAIPSLLDNLQDSANQVGLSDFKPVASVQLAWRNATNDPALRSYLTQRQDVLFQIAGALRSSGNTVAADKLESEAQGGTSVSPEGLKGFVQGVLKSTGATRDILHGVMTPHTGAPASGSDGGWTKQTSPSTGAVRWINKATGETRNTAP